MTPLVSIIILAYNQEAFIEEAVESAIAQQYPTFEVVVADDASTDGTRPLLEDLRRRYPDRVRLVLGESNGGVTLNANRGLCAAQGEFIAFQGGDDVLLPTKLSRQVDWFAKTPTGVLCGHDVEFFDGRTGATLGSWSKRHGLPSGRGARSIVRDGVPCPGPSAMLRRVAIPAGGFDERLRVSSDWWLYIETVGAQHLFGALPEVLARYRRNVGSVSDQTSEIRPIQQQGYEDGFVTLSLAEARYPEWASECAIGRARLHYARVRTWLKQRDLARAKAEAKAIGAGTPGPWAKSRLLVALARAGGVSERVIAWQERRASHDTRRPRP